MMRGGIGVLALVAMAGCDEGGVPEATMTRGEEACLREVARQSGTSEVVLMSSAAGYITVGVGSGRTPWQCVMNGGRVTQVQTLGAGGAL